MILFQPFLAFFRCAAKFAILGWWISLLFLAGVAVAMVFGKDTSGGRVQTNGLSVSICNSI